MTLEVHVVSPKGAWSKKPSRWVVKIGRRKDDLQISLIKEDPGLVAYGFFTYHSLQVLNYCEDS